ncbi:MAG TPA: FkbM family methyltransferase [Clostridia bacterium]|nr:FkbM family methyltransferase [Clostridia bacterium]
MDYKAKTYELVEERYSDIKKIRENNIKAWSDWNLSGNNKICFYGAGQVGNDTYKSILPLGVKVDFFCDSNPEKWGKEIVDGIKCISLQELYEMKYSVLCFVTAGISNSNVIYRQLVNAGLTNIVRREEYVNLKYTLMAEKLDKTTFWNNLSEAFDFFPDEESHKILYYKVRSLVARTEEWKEFSFADLYQGNQFFGDNAGNVRKDEVIIDCGAYRGSSLKRLVEGLGYSDFKKYICYELDANNYNILKKYIDALPQDISSKVEAYNYGVGSENKKITYDSSETESMVVENGAYEGEIISMDDHQAGKEGTFIKMDIEGSELEALIGAQKIIKENKPVCALSIYHKIEDLWEIPRYLRKLVPEYRFKLKHHHYCWYETVCYATADYNK